MTTLHLREARRLAPYMQPILTEARLARQWSRIVEAPASVAPARRRLAYAALCALALVPALLLVSWRMRSRAASLPEAGLTAIEGGAVTLSDGSRIAVESGGRVRVVDGRSAQVELALEAGAVSLDVPHRDRRLVVHVGRYDVVDRGTRFRVALGPTGEVGVRVTEGTVEVRTRVGPPEPVRELSAGDDWSNASPPSGAPAPRPDTASDRAVVAADALPVAPPISPVSASSPPAAADGASSAKDLLELAERQRVAGNLRAAAAALDMLRKKHRGDPRAPLAAFELGRLRLDSFGDAHGAIEALSDSIALAPNGPLREDAEARRVEALDIEHASDCAAARDAFLARYPHGVHRAVVAARCAAP